MQKLKAALLILTTSVLAACGPDVQFLQDSGLCDSNSADDWAITQQNLRFDADCYISGANAYCVSGDKISALGPLGVTHFRIEGASEVWEQDGAERRVHPCHDTGDMISASSSK